MKRLLTLGTIVALAFATTGQAKDHRNKHANRVVTTRNVVAPGVTTNRMRTVTTRYVNGGRYYTNGGRYYGGGRYYYGGGYPYYYSSGPSVSIGLGTGWGYPYYGYGYGYGGYPYYGYGYNGYPYNNGYTRYTTGGNVVAEVQRRLAQNGYYHGTIDGAAGARTRAAVANWEANHGMYADGHINSRLLHSLGLS